MEIGSRIRSARNGAGYTQERAAEALGVSRQTVSNWETGKSYPDIVSVIRMSDLYSVSLDSLLREERSMNKEYMEYLEESTDTVKSDDRKVKAALIAAALTAYAVTQLVFCVLAQGAGAAACTAVFKGVLLPASAFLLCAYARRRDWWGGWKWAFIALYAALFLSVPYVSYVSAAGEAMRTFLWPNFAYMPAGAAAALAGLIAGGIRGRGEK